MLRTLHTGIAVLGLLVASFAAAQGGDAGKADAELNASYKALLSQLGTPDQQRLRDAQRAWIAFRDKECAFRTQGNQGGSVGAATAADCVGELTRQRAKALKRQLDCPEGDVSCVPRNRSTAAAAQKAAAAAPCSKTLGKAKAAVLVDRCIQVSPATHPPCNASNACELIIDEIKRSCALFTDGDAPPFCKEYAEGG